VEYGRLWKMNRKRVAMLLEEEVAVQYPERMPRRYLTCNSVSLRTVPTESDLYRLRASRTFCPGTSQHARAILKSPAVIAAALAALGVHDGMIAMSSQTRYVRSD
jgi:hypothetical protein